MESLVMRLNELCDDQPFETSWYFKDLHSGRSAERNGDVVVPSASTRKIAILMAALKAVHEGRFALDQPVTIQAKYQDNDSGTFQYFQPGFTIQFRDALTMMIIVSDNTCTGTITDLVGLDAVNALCRSIGMTGTTHRFGMPLKGLGRDHPLEAANTTTPNDVGLLLDLILQGSADPAAAARLGCTPDLCRLALDILSWQKLNNRLPVFLPAGTKVAHKTGTGLRNNNDAGIVYRGEQPLFVLTVYTDNLPQDLPDMSGFARASLLIGRLARTCYDALAADTPALAGRAAS
jgi:beta-lactamase class A